MAPLNAVDGQTDRLRRHRAPDGTLLSLYTAALRRPRAIGKLPAQIDSLLSTAEAQAADTDRRHRRRLQLAAAEVRRAALEHASDSLGAGLALFASADGGLLADVILPCDVPDRAVFGVRSQLRPLLLANTVCRPYPVIVIDQRNAWLFRVSGSTVRMARTRHDLSVRDRSYAGWYGLEEYRVRHRAETLALKHYRLTASDVTAILRSEPDAPVVIGGHEPGVSQFVASLSPRLRHRIAGTFAIDPHTMTLTDIQTHGALAIGRWNARRELALMDRLDQLGATGSAVQGIPQCIDAVNASLVDTLVVRGSAMIPGYVCYSCDAIRLGDGTCDVCGGHSLPLPDVIDEAVARVLDSRGSVEFFEADAGKPMLSAITPTRWLGNGRLSSGFEV